MDSDWTGVAAFMCFSVLAVAEYIFLGTCKNSEAEFSPSLILDGQGLFEVNALDIVEVVQW